MKNIKKMLLCAGMATYLITFKGCNDEKVETNLIMSQTEDVETNLIMSQIEDVDKIIEQLNNIQIEKIPLKSCVLNHLDQNSLDIKYLTSGSKYITNESLFYSIRENFLESNSNFKYDIFDSEKVDEIFNSVINLNYYENDQIKYYIGEFIDLLQVKYNKEFTSEEILELISYKEQINNYYTYFGFSYKSDDVINELVLESISGNSENLSIKVKNDNNLLHKTNMIYPHVYDIDKFMVDQKYTLNLENILVVTLVDRWSISKREIINENYTCDSCTCKLALRVGLETIEIELNEEQNIKVLNAINNASLNKYTLNEFLIINNDLFVELFGVNYLDFLEINQNSLSYKKL